MIDLQEIWKEKHLRKAYFKGTDGVLEVIGRGDLLDEIQ